MKRYLVLPILSSFILIFGSINAFAQLHPVCEIFNYQPQTYVSSSCRGVKAKRFVNSNKVSSWAGGELVLITISNSVEMGIYDSRKNETINNLIGHKDFPSNPLIVMSGGFFQNDSSSPNQKSPEGLLIIEGHEVNLAASWDEGGFIAQDKNGVMMIIPLSSMPYVNKKNIQFAIQTLPIVVSNGKNEIQKKSINKAHRIGIGFDKENNLVIAIAFAKHPTSFSLYELGMLLTYPKALGGPELDTFIALDGGPAAYLNIPCLKLEFGKSPTEVSYIPNLIFFENKQ